MLEALQSFELKIDFSNFRKGIIGINETIQTPYHQAIPLVYTDWTASGRMYEEIENRMIHEVYPLIANTHTETNTTGKATTRLYHEAQDIIKNHVGANENDVLISDGSGMTGVVNKFQRILGLKINEKFKNQIELKEEDKPIVFVTHMEHHSNHISWAETIADVCIIPADKNGLPCLASLEELVAKYAKRKHKFASVTAASNVTGILVDYKSIAKIMHLAGGKCFVDFACGGPYLNIDMHPENELERLDAIFLSPHKFLGGPSTSGLLIFSNELYSNSIPDHPGGGTVVWTSPYRKPRYFDNIEEREDGGTPGFLQLIRTALAIRLKESMSTTRIGEIEHAQVKYVMERFKQMPSVQLVEGHNSNRLAIFSFYIPGINHNIIVRMLNDRFGIQVRGGCSCAGTYGHFIFGIDENQSCSIIAEVESGKALAKPGWVRMSLHPTTSAAEMKFVCDSIEAIALNHEAWSMDYEQNPSTGAVRHKNELANSAITLFRTFE